MKRTLSKRARHLTPNTTGTLLTTTLLVVAGAARAQDKPAVNTPAAAPAQNATAPAATAANSVTTPTPSAAGGATVAPAAGSTTALPAVGNSAAATPVISSVTATMRAPLPLSNVAAPGPASSMNTKTYRASSAGLNVRPITSSDPQYRGYFYLADPDTLDPVSLRAALRKQGSQNTPPAKPDAPKSASGAPATPAAPAADAGPPSRAIPSPLDSPPFPSGDWVVPVIGENQDAPTFALQKALFGHSLDKSRIKIYGWVDVGGLASTSHNSNTPLSYTLVPNKPELDQLILRIERQPDTVQTDHTDYGFRLTNLFGIDYRYTVANGYDSDQLVKHNNLYGYDFPELYGQVYLPKVAQGTVIQFGRYISPMDIEAQLSPQNYIYSHSVMFSYDPYTFTGANAEIRLSKQILMHIGAHGGNDTALWTNTAHLNFELLLGYVSLDGKDSLWGGIDSLGPSGKYAHGHDNLQVFGGVWGHKFNSKLHTQTEGYYIFQYDAAKGGTAIDGPTYSYAGGGGPGPIIPGRSYALGFVNYLEYKVNNRDYVSFRNDFLDDAQGQRTGFVNKYSSHTIGYSHFLNATTIIRPEFRYDHAYTNPAYDNGTKREQFTLGGDIIFRF